MLLGALGTARLARLWSDESAALVDVGVAPGVGTRARLWRELRMLRPIGAHVGGMAREA